MLTKMIVAGLTTDPVDNAPIVILEDAQSGRRLPLFIGIIEASAIARELEKVPQRRPLAHDLLRAAVEALGGAVQRINIVDWRDNTYFSSVVLSQGVRTVEVDARPSDAIALALRTGAPIFCASHLLDRLQAQKKPCEVALPPNLALPVRIDGPSASLHHGPLLMTESKRRSLAELLENLPPETFGKYKM